MGYNVKNLRGLYVSQFLLILLTFILSIILYSSHQFNDGILKDLSKNWKMNPIRKITEKISNSKNNNLNRNLGVYPNKKKEFINIWRNKEIEIETLDSFNYYNVYSNNDNLKSCGTDDEGNYLYFPKDTECPINFIEITDNETSSFYHVLGSIPLDGNKYLHYSNKNINGKILVQLQISQHYPCPNIDYDNNFCPILNICDNQNKIGCHLEDYLKNKYNYEFLDHDLASNFLTYIDKIDDFNSGLNVNFNNVENTSLINQNDIKQIIDYDKNNYYAYDSNNSNVFILYKRSWIGYYSNLEDKKNERNVKKKLKNFINMGKYCKRKNRTLLAFSILIFIFIIGKIICNDLLKNKDYFIFADILILIFLFIDIILNSVTISRYYSFNSNFFKFEFFNYFKHNEKKTIKIEITLLIFNWIFFIVEFLLFFFDFYQLENFCIKHKINILQCCKKCMYPINNCFDVKDENLEKKRTMTNESLLKDDENKKIEININQTSRLERELIEKLKKMNKTEIKKFQRKIMMPFENENQQPLIIITEESERKENGETESIDKDLNRLLQDNSNNNEYSNLKQYIIDKNNNNNNNNDDNNNNNNNINNNDNNNIIQQNNITIYNKKYETILKKNDDENKDNELNKEIEKTYQKLIQTKNINFSQIKSEAIIIQNNLREDTPHGNFGYIKKFRINNCDKEFVFKIPLLNKENSERIIEKDLVKIEEINLEVELLKKFKHKNIIRCYGRRLKNNKIPCMVLENCEGGDLKKVLNKNNVTNEFKIKMMTQLAKALIYLHDKGYVHSDLKCDNILLDKPYNENDYPNLKLADFGCAVAINEKYNNGHILYRAIEAIKDKECIVTDKLDVYSYASTCYEIIKESPPFDDNVIYFDLVFRLLGMYHPSLDGLECSNEMKKLLEKCWDENPKNRPNMINVFKILKEINIFEN